MSSAFRMPAIAVALMISAAITSGGFVHAGEAMTIKYRGQITPSARAENNPASKDFLLELYVSASALQGDGTQNIFWLLEETGAGGWAWPERFGGLTKTAGGKVTGTLPRLLHEHDGVEYPFTLPAPYFSGVGEWKEGKTWTADDREFVVQGQKRKRDHSCWQVESAGKFGRTQTFWIDTKTGLLIAASRKVFMGRGDQFTIELELHSAGDTADADAAAVKQFAQPLLDLQAEFARKVRSADPLLSEKQLVAAQATLGKFLAEKSPQTENTSLQEFVTAVSRDVNGQTKRDQKLVNLGARVLNRPAPQLKDMPTLAGGKVSSSDFGKDIVLLHFWKYHDSKLTEPYGQVGYVDFLRSKREKLGVQVYGVAVDEQFGTEATAGTAKRGVRKLQEFMNLGYPILLDDGNLLKAFGDPRQFGGALPLWILIDSAGKVVTYKVGYYKVEPNRGLEELDTQIIELIRARKAAAN